MTKPLPTAERVRELLAYDPESGVFTRRTSTSHNAKAGDVAGSVNSGGYLQIKVDGKLYKAHRLAWLFMRGEWPVNDVDHINGVRADNRFTNLREATDAENAKNAKKRTDNTSGFKGVTWDKASGKWRAKIQVNGIRYNLKLHDSPEEASRWYEGAAAIAFGDFRRITVTTTTTTIFER